MALTNTFKEAVKLGNIRRIRIMMKDSILVDPTFRKFREMANAAASVKGLYDIHDEKGFELNRENWNSEYIDKQVVQLLSNFSKERIEHIEEVIDYLNPSVKITHTNNDIRSNEYLDTNSISYKEQKHRDQQQGRYKYSKFATGAVAGAVVGGVVASAVGATVVTGAVAGAVVGGVAVSIVSNGGK